MINSYLILQDYTTPVHVATAAGAVANPTAATVRFSNEVGGSYTSIISKITSGSVKTGAAAVNTAAVITPTITTNGVAFSFKIRQYNPVNGEWTSNIMASVTPLTGTVSATTVCNTIRVWLNAMISAGQLIGVASGTTTAIFTPSAAAPIVQVSVITTNLAVTGGNGTASVGATADLVRAGIPSALLQDTGGLYDIYTFVIQEQVAPEEGGVEETWRELTLYLGRAATNVAGIRTALATYLV